GIHILIFKKDLIPKPVILIIGEIMPQFIINVSGLDMLKLVTLFRRQRRATEIAHDLSIQK
ncbi:TPA: hypothetical protein ACGBSU_004223, partial [Salmonella enterica subsp. enterica serovar Paratyphi A]